MNKFQKIVKGLDHILQPQSFDEIAQKIKDGGLKNFYYLEAHKDFIETIQHFEENENAIIMVSPGDYGFYDTNIDTTSIVISTNIGRIIGCFNTDIFKNRISAMICCNNNSINLASNINCHDLLLGLTPDQSSLVKQTKDQEKTNILYCNFSFYSHPSRSKIFKKVKDSGIESKIVEKPDFDVPEVYFENIAKSMFTVCPQGTGVDTLRMYEALYLGSIPIVFDSPFAKRISKFIPCIVVNDIAEITNRTDDHLRRTYEHAVNNIEKYCLETLDKRIFEQEIMDFIRLQNQ